MNGFRDTASNQLRSALVSVPFSFRVSRTFALLLLSALPAVGQAIGAGVPTTIALSANATSVSCGADVALVANLYPFSSSTNLTNGETVSFYNGSTLVGTAALQNGAATFHITARVAGTLSLFASFVGDVNFLASTSNSVQVQVGVCAPPIAISTSLALTNTVPSNRQVTLTASLYPPSGGGRTTDGQNITFYSNNTVLGTGALASGTATLIIPTPPAGTYDLASYNGDAYFGGSTSNSVQPGNGAPGGTGNIRATTLALYGTSSGIQTSLTADLYPYFDGNVSTNGELITFFSNGQNIGSGILLNGRATLNAALPLAGASVLALYSGDSALAASTSNSVQSPGTVTLPTSLAVHANVNPIAVGGAVILTANLFPYLFAANSTDGESVTFYNNNTVVGTAILLNGTASVTLTSLPAGDNQISASYSFDAHFSGSFSNVLKETVGTGVSPLIATSVALKANAPSILNNASLQLTATVYPHTEDGKSLNGELIRFSANGTVLGTSPIVNGVATFNVLPNTLPVGVVELIGDYSGDAAFTGSTSNLLQETVAAAVILH